MSSITVHSQLISTEMRIIMSRLNLNPIERWWRVGHDHLWKELRCVSLEIACPLLVVIDADWEADRAVVVLGEVGEAEPGVDHITIEAKMIFPRRGASLVGDGVCRTVDAAGAAVVAEGSDSRVDR